MEFSKRKEIRLKEYDYSTSGAYFITVCTKDKKHLLWKREKGSEKQSGHVGADTIRPSEIKLTEYGEIVKQAIENIPKYYKNVYVDKYVIMPNHIHIIIFIDEPDNGRMISAPTRSVVIGQMKRYASKTAGISLWQKSFYDHVIRNYNDYSEKWNYIDSNPYRWSDDEYNIQ